MLEPLPRVELADALAFLEKRFGIDGDNVEYVGEGAWSRCFGFVLNGSEVVIRVGRHLEDFQRDRIAARFAARDLPIPQVTEIDEAFGAWYCISTSDRLHCCACTSASCISDATPSSAISTRCI